MIEIGMKNRIELHWNEKQNKDFGSRFNVDKWIGSFPLDLCKINNNRRNQQIIFGFCCLKYMNRTKQAMPLENSGVNEPNMS